LATALCYALGSVVVNRNLARFGYFSFSLLRANYIGAGFWATAPLLFTVIMFTSTAAFSDDEAGSEKKRTLGRHVWSASATMIGGLTAALALLSLQIYCGVSIGNLLGGMLAAVVVVFCLSACRMVFAQGRPAPPISRAKRFRFAGLVAILPIALWAYLSFCAAIYSQVPSSLGGGKPRRVTLVVDSSRVSRAQLSSVALTPDSLWRVRAPLLLRTDNAVVLASATRERAIELPTSAIRLVEFSRVNPPVTGGQAVAVRWIETFGATFFDPDSLP
jgi:hypothetical protein